MDIDTKIKELQRDLERLEAELDSINRANYDGHETETLKAKEKQIREKQSELLKYKKAREMASIKDSMEILRLSGFTTDADWDARVDFLEDKIRKLSKYGDRDSQQRLKGYREELKSIQAKQTKDLDPSDYEETMTTAEAREYWNKYHNSDPILKDYKSFAEWYRESKINGYIKDETSKDAKFEVMYTIGHFHDPETLKDKKEIIQANSAGEARRMIENKWKGNLNRIIQITQVHDSCSSKDGYKMEDPKEIEAAIKQVKASGHPNPQYLAGLERALVVAKRERGMKDSCGEKIFTKGTAEDAEEQWITMNGAHIKVEEGESKESAAKKFISSKGGSSNKSKSKPTKEISKGVSSGDLELSEEEVSKIKQKFSKIKDPDSDTGSEYGHYVDAMRSQLRKKGKYPDMSELDDIKDKMWYMRQGGKKDTPEYKELEKQKNEWNKNFNKIEKEIKNKAYELSSPNEKKRLDEISSFFKKNPTKMGDSANPGQEVKIDLGRVGYKDLFSGKVKVLQKKLVRESDPKLGYVLKIQLPNGGTYWVHEKAVIDKAEDACSNKDANYSGWSKRDISYDLRSKEDFLRSLEDDLRSGEYNGTVQGIKSPEALKSLIRKTKQQIEEAKRAMGSAKDSAIQKECNEILKLSGFIS